MRNMAVLLAVMGIVMSVSVAHAGNGCPCMLAKADAKASAVAVPAAAAVQAAPVDAGNKICPVLGNPVSTDPAATAEYKGKTYHFCCPGCKAAFQSDPETYIKKLEEASKSVK